MAAPEPASRGSTCSWAIAVAATKSGWKTSARMPTAASVAAYATSGAFQRVDHRLASQEPSAIPPMKMASTSVCAYAACPRKSFR